MSPGHVMQLAAKLLAATLLVCTLTAAGTLIYLTLQGSKPDTRPHIIIVLADDLGWDDVSFHGSSQIPTPNLDAFASSGVILNSHYAAPFGAATRGSLFTGKLPLHIGLHESTILTGVYGTGLPLNHKLMPEYLRNLGYETHLIGKWNLGFYKESLTPTKRGFDTHYGPYSGSGTYFSHFATEHSWQDTGIPPGYDFHDNGKTDFSAYGKYVTELYDNRFKQIVENRDRDKRLFVVLSHMAPHGAYPGNTFQLPESQITSSDFSYIQDKTRSDLAQLVRTLDNSFGRTVKVLADNGLLKDSIILFMSDNGGTSIQDDYFPTGASNWPFRGQKHTQWEGGLRVASFLWSSRTRDAYVNNKLYHVVDWLPTFYTLAGGSVEELGAIDGLDIWNSVSENNTASPRTDVLLFYDRTNTVNEPGFAAIKNNFKLVQGKLKLMNKPDWYLAAGNNSNRTETDEAQMSAPTAQAALDKISFSRSIGQDWKLQATIQCNWSAYSEIVQCNEGFCSDVMLSPTGESYQTVAINAFNESEQCNYEHEACLFDLENDPCEIVNVASQYPSVLQDILDYVYNFEAAEPAAQLSYKNCLDKNSNPGKSDPPAWEPWAFGCDGLLGEPCQNKPNLTDNDDVCPPGGIIMESKDEIELTTIRASSQEKRAA